MEGSHQQGLINPLHLAMLVSSVVWGRIMGGEGEKHWLGGGQQAGCLGQPPEPCHIQISNWGLKKPQAAGI